MLRLEKRASQSQKMLWLSPILAIALTLLTGSIIFSLLGHSPLTTLYTLFISPLMDLYGWTELAVKTIPILLCAIGLNLCFKAQIWNIGAEGQFIIGAIVGASVALLYPDTSSYFALVCALCAGIFAGMAWAGIAAWLRAQLNTNEVLTTIMLNYIAVSLLAYAVHGPLKDPDGYNFPQSALLGDYLLLPLVLEDYRMTISIFFAALALSFSWLLLGKTLVGFQISVLGQDERAVTFAGFKKNRIIWFVFLVSGGLAGLAGISEVSGPIGQLVPDVASGYGYTAIIVVFLGRMSHLGILLASLLLGTTYLGGEMVQMELNLSSSVSSLLQGLLLFYLLACDVLIKYRVVSPSNQHFSLPAKH